MHIPDGYLSPETYLPLYGVFIVTTAVAVKKAERQLDLKTIPWLGMVSAFSFLIMMFNIPIPGGTTGHAIGGAAITLLLGPWIGSIAITTALVIQAFIFGDGGITALGANCLNMGYILCFSSWFIYKLLARSESSEKRKNMAAFFSGYIGVNLAALATATELGLQPLIAVSSSGVPLYCPYPLSVTLPAMMIEHLCFFGVAEGLITVFVFRYVRHHHPELIRTHLDGIKATTTIARKNNK